MSCRRGRRRSAAALGGQLATVASLAWAPALPAAAVTEPVDKPRNVAVLNSYEQQLLARLNDVRSRRGQVKLTPSPGLTAAAELHSQRMVRRGFFEHEAPGEPPFWRRIERFYPSRGFDYWAVGENLAYGQPSLLPAEAVQEWLESPKHRRSLLSPLWREAGLAVTHAAAAPGEYGGEPVTVVTLDLGVRRE